ncbi:MAG TPA: maleylpyruvate isomerase family mycothiol-dependent enzyme [Streptosporangiaceae bacterium]|nr:maleylpyruvate isomerase family mycothiol-dependent enzyme [Streptosporangiaceae bacterium]
MSELPSVPADVTASQADPRDAEQERIVTLLGQEWSVIADLLAGLTREQWSLPVLPGWDVHDVLAHLVGTERTLTGAKHPQVPDQLGEHVRNDIARLNEAWIVALRELSDAQLLAQFRTVTAQRLAALTAMTADDFFAPSWTPAGNATYDRFMKIRIFDCWMHEQDIRAAVGTPGNDGGAVADQALAEVTGALGYIIGKRGQAPQGSSVRITLTGPIQRELNVVVAGKAQLVDALAGEPTAAIALSSSLFLRLTGGREDARAALARVELAGDVGLGRQLATNLAFTI